MLKDISTLEAWLLIVAILASGTAMHYKTKHDTLDASTRYAFDQLAHDMAVNYALCSARDNKH